MHDLKKLYSDLLMTSLFGGVTDTSLFRRFFAWARATDKDEAIKAYADFVKTIYENGGSLTDCVHRLVFEDENVYVKMRARGEAVSPEIETALRAELSVLNRFASLSPEDFAADMELEYVSPFAHKKESLAELYYERVEDIRKRGYGIFSSYPMFRLSDERTIEPIVSADKTSVEKFVGYEAERQKVIDNTLAFLLGKPAANVLLEGDAGTGKSSTVKAVANRFFDEGIRLIELRKDQLSYLPYVMGRVSENPLKFIIFIDDLSFNQNDDNFSMLKAALEGSASARADNAVIYATSNRRHIIKESFADRDGDDVHRNDTMQETLSLSERFGLVVHFSRPTKQLYLEIVHELAERAGITLSGTELDLKAEEFALRRGSRSARCAEQFIDSLI